MIEKKLKKCKGIDKAIGYGCFDLKYIHRYGLCSKCFQNWLMTEDGKETLDNARIVGKKKVEISNKKEFVKKKNDNKSIAKLIHEARTPFQKLIRIRDHGKCCICCDKHLPFNIGDYDAGHFLKAELYTGLIFHPDNVHGQLVYCNKYNNGNENGYSDNIINRIGADRLENLNTIKSYLKSYYWDRSKLIEMKKYYNLELRLVEKGIKNINDVDFSIGIIK